VMLHPLEGESNALLQMSVRVAASSTSALWIVTELVSLMMSFFTCVTLVC